MMRQLIRLSSQNPAELFGWLSAVMNGLLFIKSVSTVYQQVTEVSRTKLQVWHSFVWMPRLHALGMGHEQARPDRDDYVTVHWQNIKSGMASQFEKKLGIKWNEGYWRLGGLCFWFGAWTVRVGRRFWTRFDQRRTRFGTFLGRDELTRFSAWSFAVKFKVDMSNAQSVRIVWIGARVNQEFVHDLWWPL